MSKNFPDRNKLSSMSIDWIRSQIPMDQEDEQLMDEVLKIKVKDVPVLGKVKNDDVPMIIKSPEEEAKWQAVIDERQKQIETQFKGEDVVLEKEIEKMEEEKKEIEAELPKELPQSTVKCELCGTKNWRHKKDCPTLNGEQNTSDN